MPADPHITKKVAPAAQMKESLPKRFFRSLGPGVITGAADDDPSGVTTYSIAGAQFGTGMLWTAFLTWPMMGAVQMMCAQIGMVTGAGLTGALRKKFPRWLIITASFALLAANTINMGADLGGMADAVEMLTSLNAKAVTVFFGLGIALLTIRFPYHQIAGILKWLCLCLFAYVITAFLVVSEWRPLLKDTFIPSLPRSSEAWSILVAILGTTISPYLFYWQASQEVEEKKAMGRRTLTQRRGATLREFQDRHLDVGAGTFFSNLVMYFIIVTTAATLHKHGVTHIENSRQAAEALRPLAGRFATLLYTAGIIGTGLLAIPVLSGSAAYALAETFHWTQGLDQKFKRARAFYAVIAISTLMGVALNFLKINPVKALYTTGIINGLLAPILLVGILMVGSDKKVMRNQPCSWRLRIAGIATAVVMFGAAIAMFVF